MGYTHFDKVSGETGLYVGKKGDEVSVADTNGNLFHAGVQLTPTAGQLNKLITALTTVTAKDGSTGQKTCLTNGVTSITGGTGIADMTLAAPSAGDVAIIRINSLTSGSVVVTTAAGVTFNGTNNTATFDAISETLVLTYKAANTWQIVMNVGAVALTTVG